MNINRNLKILDIVPLPSYNYNDGGAINFLNRSKYLKSKSHSIDFIIFKEKNQNTEYLENNFENSLIIKLKLKHKLTSFIKSIFSNKPYTFFRHNLSKTERNDLNNFIQKEKYDIIIFETIHSYPLYIELKDKIESTPIVYFAHNIDYLDILNASNISNLLKKIFFKIESIKDKRIEYNFIRNFKLIFSVSPKDMEIIRKINKEAKISFCPAIIDLQPLNQSESRYSLDKYSNYKYRILFTGNLHYPSNINAVQWFTKYVIPILNEKIDFCFMIVGRNPSKEVIKLQHMFNNIFIFADVESLHPFYKIADLVVIPLFNNAGVKIKLIEALKYQKKVVSRPEGVYGSGLSEIIPSGDTPEEFAKKCVEVLDNNINYNEILDIFNKIYNNDLIIEKFETNIKEFLSFQ
jgi:hypothetical protein